MMYYPGIPEECVPMLAELAFMGPSETQHIATIVRDDTLLMLLTANSKNGAFMRHLRSALWWTTRSPLKYITLATNRWNKWRKNNPLTQ